jgi:GT2 family glycosyltransferase
MTVYVGVVTYNSAKDLPGCFEGLQKQTFSAINIRVWDNASVDGTLEWLSEKASNVPVYMSEQNLGFGRGHNRLLRAIDLTAGDCYLTLNPDVRLDSEYIARLINALEQHDASWGTGKLLKMDIEGNPTGEIYSVGHAILRDGYFFNIGYGMQDDGQFDEGREVFGAPGASALYSAELIESISQDGEFFDEQMFMYGEDTDVDWRARNRGWKCWYEPRAVAHHRGSEPGSDMKVEAISSRYLSVIKNVPSARLITCNLPVMVAHAATRILVSPRAGLRLLGLVSRGVRITIEKRRASQPGGTDLKKWLRWSDSQPSLQPKSIGGRIRAARKSG